MQPFALLAKKSALRKQDNEKQNYEPRFVYIENIWQGNSQQLKREEQFWTYGNGNLMIFPFSPNKFKPKLHWASAHQLLGET